MCMYIYIYMTHFVRRGGGVLSLSLKGDIGGFYLSLSLSPSRERERDIYIYIVSIYIYTHIYRVYIWFRFLLWVHGLNTLTTLYGGLQT